MSSNINPNNINGNFPVAGQDNDSQGFRDNFTNILNNFSFAATEITDLQNSVTNIQNVVQSNGNVEAYFGNVAQSLSVGVNASVGGDLYVTGNITGPNGNVDIPGKLVVKDIYTNGLRVDSTYQYYAPSTNFTYTFWSNVSRLILDPTTTITNGNVLLPSSNIDGLICTMSSTQDISMLKVTPNNGTTLVPSGNITLYSGQSASYIYHGEESKWYKIS
jgi:hypothetical protein